jgi:hypothetical protein
LLLDFHEHGAARLHGAAAPFLPALEDLVAAVPVAKPGVRLRGVPGLAGLLAADALGAAAAGLLGTASRPVRAILFDKSAAANWALGWHQDRTIAVAACATVAGFGPWSRKAGMQHVEPPFALIERMVTIRVHLDPVPADNAPLLIAPRSQRLGKIAEADLAAVVERCGTTSCLAERGDVWVYATPILHASATATAGGHRRVLQVDFSADRLPPPLEWLGV